VTLLYAESKVSHTHRSRSDDPPWRASRNDWLPVLETNVCFGSKADIVVERSVSL